MNSTANTPKLICPQHHHLSAKMKLIKLMPDDCNKLKWKPLSPQIYSYILWDTTHHHACSMKYNIIVLDIAGDITLFHLKLWMHAHQSYNPQPRQKTDHEEICYYTHKSRRLAFIKYHNFQGGQFSSLHILNVRRVVSIRDIGPLIQQKLWTLSSLQKQ